MTALDARAAVEISALKARLRSLAAQVATAQRENRRLRQLATLQAQTVLRLRTENADARQQIADLTAKAPRAQVFATPLDGTNWAIAHLNKADRRLP
ncbi:hypothetical protein [Streptomyces formicae]